MKKRNFLEVKKNVANVKNYSTSKKLLKSLIKSQIKKFIVKNAQELENLSPELIELLLEVEGCKLCNLPHIPTLSIVPIEIGSYPSQSI